MFNEFTQNTQRFGVKKVWEPVCLDEAMVKFENEKEIRSFFQNAMKDRTNCGSIQQIAKNVAPTYCCRSIKNQRSPSDQERLETLFSEIACGNANVVLKNDGLKAAHKTEEPVKGDDKNFFDNFDFIEFAKEQANHLKKIYSKMVHADYPILEQVFNYDENSTGAVPAIIDQSSVKEHSTGWKSWDDPFEISALGLFKAFATYKVSKFLKLSDNIMMIALAGSQTELVSAQYLVTGKSINSKRWFGSYAVRYNLRTLNFEVPWVRYRGCGPEERMR